MDDIRVTFSKHVRSKCSSESSKKCGAFIADFTERIVRANRSVGLDDVWGDVLESWLLNGRVRDISESRDLSRGNEEEYNDEADDPSSSVEKSDDEKEIQSYWDSTLNIVGDDKVFKSSSAAIFDFSSFRNWYKKSRNKTSATSTLKSLRHVILDSNTYLLEAITSFWSKKSIKLDRGEEVLKVYFSWVD